MTVKELQLDLIPQLKALDVRAKRKVLSRVLEGSWVAMLKGRGMEFAGFRQYTYGDDASRIDWNATLRAKEVLVREFEEYKSINVFFLLDVSDTMLFTSTSQLKCEYAAELMFHTATAILDAGNSVGYALFTDHIVRRQPPAIGREVIYRLAKDLQDGAHYGGESDLKQALGLVNSVLGQRALIILISDYLDLGDGWERYIRMLSANHDLIGIMIRDPHDTSLPLTGVQVVVQDNETREQLLVDTRDYARRYEAEAALEEGYVQSVFTKAKAGFLKVDTTRDAFTQLTHYFRKRANMYQG